MAYSISVDLTMDELCTIDANQPSTNQVDTPIDFIDLTKDTPVRPRQRRVLLETEVALPSSSSTNNPNQNLRRILSPMVLGNTLNTIRNEVMSNISHLNETLDLNNKAQEDNKICGIISDTEEIRPLSCPVCLELLRSSSKPISTSCGHVFCTQCLSNVVKQFHKCPLCNKVITLKSCRRIHFNF